MITGRIALALALLCIAWPAAGASPSREKPQLPDPGEIGKDVMWIPSEGVMVERMLDVARLSSSDHLVDLGSGDGRVVLAAARRGARATGVEYNPELVKYAAWKAQQAGLARRARFEQGDLFQADLARASVITLFLLEENNLKLRPRLLGLRPGTRIVSNSFAMGDWRPDRELSASVKEGCTAYCTAYLWIVPARVEGTWSVRGGELELRQSFQQVTGVLRTAGAELPVQGSIKGDRIAFGAGAAQYSGRVGRDRITGAVRGGDKRRDWSATRKGA